MLIHLADRIDIALQYGADKNYLQKLFNDKSLNFPADVLEKMERCLKERNIPKIIEDETYREKNIIRCNKFFPSTTETLEYLKMVVYSIDYRSEHTVTHTVNTVSLALNIARHFGLSDDDTEKIYLGALLHDVGKIAIPVDILEYPGKLNDEQMVIMRTHVDETEGLIRGIIPDDICEIAIRHHEKLDGSGYPRGLKADDLNFEQRIVAVADIVSALGSRRSYKEPFPKDKTIAILTQMSASQLDPEICKYVCENYNDIMASTDKPRQQIIEQYQSIMNEYESAKAAVC